MKGTVCQEPTAIFVRSAIEALLGIAASNLVEILYAFDTLPTTSSIRMTPGKLTQAVELESARSRRCHYRYQSTLLKRRAGSIVEDHAQKTMGEVCKAMVSCGSQHPNSGKKFEKG